MSVDGIRARNRAAIEAEILRVAGEQLAHTGAAALSLRAVARDLGMTPSALYRYVADRDDLLTLLIIDSYTSMADSVEAALDRSAAVAPADRFRTIGRSTRAWALDHPHRYALIYGSPVPDYRAPADRTTEAGTRVPNLLLAVLADLPAPPEEPATDRALAGMLADPATTALGIGGAILRRGLTAWMLVLGAVSTELFEGFGSDAFSEPEVLFESVLDTAVEIVLD
ncbi:TetR family transcriptional regulator [Nostocoides sp. F2B08]|uniref:TetR/AcrR family transcriptional regulator n=1 Tax=Nostocoides sp. F2B08 TaxID=2653936 RepID=UPI001263A32D|nr:TetR/AcrR family transcriptional regulator [Tetrasphaera sp. F2B08]KAB7743282.1 TetR family transcriptional regulator [Tetrasphaera sp. F2B08]